jgi:tetratricopeptide (TPR) repeat protein
MRRERIAAVGVMLVASAAPLAAQKTDRLVADSASKFQIAFCNLRMQGKVGDGQKALKTGMEDKDKAKRLAALANAERILTEQVGAGGQGQSAAAWYYLGRAYLLQGDVTGADSAFDKTTQFSPDCEIDVNTYRQNAWAVLANAGIEKLRANDQDSALVLFRQASTIFDQLPHVFENMGVIYANAGQQDSAAVYFGKAAQIAEADTSLVENRNSATLNHAMTLQRMEKHAEAIPVLEKYLGWNPNDTEARRSLAWSYRQSGQAAKADSLEAAMVDEFSKMNLDSLATNDLMAVGVSMFNGKKYDEAIKVFEKLMARNE